MSSFTHGDCTRSLQQDFQVQPDHAIGSYPATTFHLPQEGNSRLHLKHSAVMAHARGAAFISDRRVRTCERPIAHQHVPELGQFIQAGRSQRMTHFFSSWICLNPKDWLRRMGGRIAVRFAGNRLVHKRSLDL